MFLFCKKNLESLHEHCPYAFSLAAGAKFVLEQNIQNSA